MAEIRKFNFDEIFAHAPNIPDNWYVPAIDLWKMTAWCFMELRNKSYVRDDKDMCRFVRYMEKWIEDHSVSIEKENEDGIKESKSV